MAALGKCLLHQALCKAGAAGSKGLPHSLVQGGPGCLQPCADPGRPSPSRACPHLPLCTRTPAPHTHLLPPQRRARWSPTRSGSLSPPGITCRGKGHTLDIHSNHGWLSNSGTSPLSCAHRGGRPLPRTCDAETLEAAEVGGEGPQRRGLGARLVQPRAQAGGQPRRRARPGQSLGGRPGGHVPEVPVGASGDWQRGGGGRAGVRSGQDGLNGKGGLEASGRAGWAWICRAAR